MTDGVNNSRRRLLTTVTTGVGLAGAAALAVPLVASMKPSARARAAGAEILLALEDQDYGGRGYTCRDPQGHVWSFGTYDPWADE